MRFPTWWRAQGACLFASVYQPHRTALGAQEGSLSRISSSPTSLSVLCCHCYATAQSALTRYPVPPFRLFSLKIACLSREDLPRYSLQKSGNIALAVRVFDRTVNYQVSKREGHQVCASPFFLRPRSQLSRTIPGEKCRSFVRPLRKSRSPMNQEESPGLPYLG